MCCPTGGADEQEQSWLSNTNSERTSREMKTTTCRFLGWIFPQGRGHRAGLSPTFLLLSSFLPNLSVQAVTLHVWTRKQSFLRHSTCAPLARMRGTCTRGWTYAELPESLPNSQVLVGMFSFHLAWAEPAHSPDQTRTRAQLCTCAVGRWLTCSQTLDAKNLCSAKHPPNILIAPDTFSSARLLLGY